MRHRRPLCLLHRVSAHVWQRVALAAAASAAFWRAGVVRLGRRGSARICARGHLHVPRRAMDHLPTASAELPKRPNHQEGWWPEQGAGHSVDVLSVAHGQRYPRTRWLCRRTRLHLLCGRPRLSPPRCKSVRTPVLQPGPSSGSSGTASRRQPLRAIVHQQTQPSRLSSAPCSVSLLAPR